MSVQPDTVRDEDRLAAERLYREDGRRLWWAVRSFAGDDDVASDAVAEAFASALGRWRTIREPKKWIWTVAFRVAAAELRRRRREPAPEPEGAPPAEPGERAVLLDALWKLPDRQRAAVVLHYYGGYSIGEIGAVLGISPATVGVHLHRGRKRLRELLEASDD